LDSLYFIYQVCKDTQKTSLEAWEDLILTKIKFNIYFAGVMENVITFRNIFQVGRQRFCADRSEKILFYWRWI